MNKHTPGPWRTGHVTTAYKVHRRKVVAESGKHVCEVYLLDEAVGEADAKLIAAAPELLATLTILMDSHEADAAEKTPENDWDEYDRMMYPRWLAAKELFERLKDEPS